MRDKFIKKLFEISPPHYDKVVLLNSGSEVTDAAYRLIKIWGKKHNKKYIVTFTGSYHGHVLGSDLIGGTSTSTDWCNFKDKEIWFLPFPKEGDELDLNDLPPLNEIAAFFLETYQGWGAWMYPQKYIDKLYKTSRDNNILFCFDEVQAGFYRMGELYGYMTYGDYKPDIITLGKGLTSSLPLAALLSTKDIIDLDSSQTTATLIFLPVPEGKFTTVLKFISLFFCLLLICKFKSRDSSNLVVQFFFISGINFSIDCADNSLVFSGSFLYLLDDIILLPQYPLI